MKKAILDCTRLAQSHEQAHAYLKEMLDLPAYYGANLDALYDCLTAVDGTLEILFENSRALLSGSYADRIADTFCQAAAEVGGHIIFAYEAPPAEAPDAEEDLSEQERNRK